jgi:hypothetical protein
MSLVDTDNVSDAASYRATIVTKSQRGKKRDGAMFQIVMDIV